MNAQMMPRQANRIAAGPRLSIVVGSIVLLAVTAAGVRASAQTKPPAGTFPAQVGRYKLKRGPEHGKSYFHVDTVDSWEGYYELAQNSTHSIGVRYTLMVFSSPDEAKQALKLHVDTGVAGRREKGYRDRIVRRGSRPQKPQERFVVLDAYFPSGGAESRLVSTTALWTDGPMLIRVESPSSVDPQQKRFEQENGLKEAAPINFMSIYPD